MPSPAKALYCDGRGKTTPNPTLDYLRKTLFSEGIVVGIKAGEPFLNTVDGERLS
jgi:hypothetical protein